MGRDTAGHSTCWVEEGGTSRNQKCDREKAPEYLSKGVIV